MTPKLQEVLAGWYAWRTACHPNGYSVDDRKLVLAIETEDGRGPETTIGEALKESRRRAPVPKYIPADNEAHSEPSGTEIAIRDRFLKGETVSSLADRFDLLQSTVREIVSGALS